MNSDPIKPKVQIHPCDTATAHVQVGHDFALLKRTIAPIKVNVQDIESVGIKSLVEVESHAVNTVFNSRSHTIRFSNGGLLKFAYNKDGQLIDLSSSDLRCEVLPNNRVVFSIPHNA